MRIEDFVTMNVEEIEAAFAAQLPRGHRLEFAWDAAAVQWCARVVPPEEPSSGVCAYSPDPKLALLNAFGEMFAEKVTRTQRPQWVRGASVSDQIRPTGIGASGDPAELDPTEVQTLYDARLKGE